MNIPNPIDLSIFSYSYIKSVRNEIVLFTVLFFGLFLRIYNLGSESIWLDEAFSIRLANFEYADIIQGSIDDTHPPLYHLLLHYWLNLFGSTEFSARFLSVILGFFSVYMIYKTGSLIFNREAGILSALILSVSVFHIHYSQEARMYSLLALLSITSMYFFIRYIKEKNLWISAGYIISCLFLIYTHIYGVFIIIAQNVFVFSLLLFSNEEKYIRLKNWILLQVILLVLFIPWIIILINQIAKVNNDFWIPVPSVSTIIKYLKVYSGSNLFYIFVLTSLLSMISYNKIKGNFNLKRILKSIEDYRWNINLSNTFGAYFLLIWLLIPNIVPFIISRISTPIYWDRYTIGASFGFYLLAAGGIKNIKNKYLKILLVGIIIIFSVLSIQTYYNETNKEQWRDVAEYIDNYAGNSDLILFNAGFNQIAFDFYSERNDLIKKSFPEKTRDVDEKNIKELMPVVKGKTRVWVILSKSHDYNNLIKKTLNNSYTLLFNKEYFINSYYTSNINRVGIEVCLFEKD